MNTIKLYEEIINAISAASYKIIGEVQIVEESIKEIGKLALPGNIKMRVAFCHQKPYAFLVDPDNLYTKVKTELGDLLFVVKLERKSVIVDIRALFLQAKYDNGFNSFKIEKHQQMFYTQIHNIIFRFGNSVYKTSGIAPIIWRNISQADQFGDFLLIGDGKALDISLEMINRQFDPSGNHFTFDLTTYRHCFPLFYPMYRHSERPLLDVLTPFGKGTSIQGNFTRFIDLIYKRLNLSIDPPKENKGFWEDDSGGFGLVELTYIEE